MNVHMIFHCQECILGQPNSRPFYRNVVFIFAIRRNTSPDSKSSVQPFTVAKLMNVSSESFIRVKSFLRSRKPRLIYSNKNK